MRKDLVRISLQTNPHDECNHNILQTYSNENILKPKEHLHSANGYIRVLSRIECYCNQTLKSKHPHPNSYDVGSD